VQFEKKLRLKTLGAKGEQIAADFLKHHGFEIVERNFRYERGEIDIIAKKDKVISFCEVKTRSTDAYGSGEDAVNLKKQRQIKKVAEGYIMAHDFDDYEFRFDVLVVELRKKQTRIRIIENAF
jgi:putative endonuclease